MFGWCSRAAALTSCWKRCTAAGVVDEAGVDDLEGDGPLHEPVLRLVDRPHAALPQQRQHAVTRVVGQFRRNGGRLWQGRRQAGHGSREGGVRRAVAGRGFRRGELGFRRRVGCPGHGFGQPGGGLAGEKGMVVGGLRRLAAGAPVFGIKRHQFASSADRPGSGQSAK